MSSVRPTAQTDLFGTTTHGAPLTKSDSEEMRGPPPEPSLLGAFSLLREIGRGGMGVVYEAEDTALQRRVALKVIRPEIAATSSVRERFLREARAAARLDNPHLVSIHQVGEEAGTLFLAMPLLQGRSLAVHIEQHAPLPLNEILRIARELLEGLAAAHALSLLHRDLKPSNVWLQAHPDHAGSVRILDFGLARLLGQEEGRLTGPGGVVGTPGYMPPEQIDGLELDARADLFGVGCILYEMATGRKAFPGPTATARLLAASQGPPPLATDLNPALPAWLAALIHRLLAPDPDARPASARGVLETITAPATVEWTAPQAPGGNRASSRRRGRWVVGGVLAAALLLAAALALHPLKDAPPEPVAPPDTSAEATPTCQVDATICVKEGEKVRKARLSEEGVLPVREGSEFHIALTARPAAYAYLFLIDTEGQAVPVYPWRFGEWNTRPVQETPVARLEIPTTAGKGYRVDGKFDGMLTLLLLVRKTPLRASDDELQACFANLGPQRPLQHPAYAARFEDGREVEYDPVRKRTVFEIKELNNPVLRTQELLRQRLAPHADSTSAISFAHE